MPRPAKKLNTASKEVIDENFLKQDPEGHDPINLDKAEAMIVAKHVPEYRRTVFTNNRDPGVALHFHYHSKTHPLKHYTLYHGFEHELPLEVINHLETCGEPQYGYRRTDQGLPEHYVTGYKYIFSFRAKKTA